MRALLFILGICMFAPLVAASEQTLKIGYSPDWAPYSITNEKTTVGILPTLLDELLTQRLGVPLEHIGLPWKRAQAQVKGGALDALITFPSEMRLEYTERSRSIVYRLESKAFVRKASAAHAALTANPAVENLKRYRGCVIYGDDWAEKFYATHAIPYQHAVDVKNCLRLLERGRVDIFIQATAVALDNIRQLNLEKSIVGLPQAYSSIPFTFLISKKSPFYTSLMPKFDAVIDDMKADGSLEKLISRLENAPQP